MVEDRASSSWTDAEAAIEAGGVIDSRLQPCERCELLSKPGDTLLSWNEGVLGPCGDREASSTAIGVGVPYGTLLPVSDAGVTGCPKDTLGLRLPLHRFSVFWLCPKSPHTPQQVNECMNSVKD